MNASTAAIEAVFGVCHFSEDEVLAQNPTTLVLEQQGADPEHDSIAAVEAFASAKP